MCESRNKRVPPRVSIQGRIITVVDPSICQTSTPNIKALDVQMLIDAPPLQLNASNDMKSSTTTVTRCCITPHLNSNLDRLRKHEMNIIIILSVGKEIISPCKYQYCSFPSSQYTPLLVLYKFCERNQNLIYRCCVVIPSSVYIIVS